MSLEAQLLPLQGALLRLGLPMAALGRILGAQPALLLCKAEEVEAQVQSRTVMRLWSTACSEVTVGTYLVQTAKR